QREGWPDRAVHYDEPQTRRTHASAELDEEATRRTSRPHQTSQDATLPTAGADASAGMRSNVRRRRRPLRSALIVLALIVIANELGVSCRARRLGAEVPTAELDTVG